MTSRTAAPLKLPGWRRPTSKDELVRKVWALYDLRCSDHEIAEEIGWSTIGVRRILARGRRVPE